MEERSLHLLDYMSVIRRRKWWLIVPVVLSVIAGGLLALLLPRQYKASTTIAVTSPSLSGDLVKSGPVDLSERVRAIQQELLSRPVLERVARDTGLADQMSMDAAVGTMRAGTTVAVPKTLAPATRSGPDTFVVTYVGSTPEMTQRITNGLASAFVDQHSKMRETRAEETSAFLSTQLGQSQTRLKAVEERLRKMKEAYMGRLPEQTQANLQMVSGLRQHQDNTAMALRSEQDRLAMLERQIQLMRQGASDAPLSKSTNGNTQERLIALRRELDQAAAMYTEKHPEIQRLKGEIASTEALVKLEAARPAAEREPVLNADPAFRQLLADRDASKLKIRELERAAARAQAEISQYQSRVEAAPMIEQQLSSLNREYELEKQQYNALAERHQSSLIVEDLERRRAGEQFAVLYPAGLPSKPDSPDVPRLLLFAIALGVVAGGVLAVGREYLDRSVYDARTLQSEYELPVLAEIPRIAQ
jgi:polysaccharide chain length determinant protein (PEP-CTERM system associated)